MPQNTPVVNNIPNFLKMIFGDDWVHAEVCSVPVLGQDDAYRSYWTTQPIANGSAVRNLDPAWNNYFCVSLMDRPGVRRKANFKALHVLVVDDVGPKVDPAKVLNETGTPTYRLETSPGNEQWGYVLEPPVTDLARAEALIVGTIQLLAGGKDPGMAGVTRLMRLPGGSNTKSHAGPCESHTMRSPRRFRRANPRSRQTARAAGRRAHREPRPGRRAL